MAIRSFPILFVLAWQLAACKSGFGQDRPARPGEFPEVEIAGPIFQPLAAAGKNHLAVGGRSLKETAFALYDQSSGQKISQFATQEIISPIALSPDGSTLAAIPGTFQKDRLVLIDTATGQAKTTLPIEKAADRVFFLNNQRVATASIWEKTALIWDLNTGKKIEQINFSHAARPDQLPLAFSPDGKKALFLRGYRIHLFEIDTKESSEIGTLEQSTPLARTVVGMAFSADGTEAVFLSETLGKQSLQTWNLERKTHGPTVEFPVAGHTFYQGERLITSPDGQGYLVNGHVLVERQSLKKLWSLPDAKPGAPSLVFPTAVNRVLRLEPSRQNLRLVEHAKPREVIAQAIALAREGKDPRGATFISGNPTGRKNAKTFEIPLGGVLWRVTPSARAETRGLAARPFPLNGPALQLGQILFASASAGMAGVEFLDQPGAGQTGATGFHLFNLGTGRKTGHFAFAQPSRAMALSPDGSTILAQEIETRDRLDLFSSQGKKLASWKPLEEGNGENERKIAFTAFTSNDRVLTIDDKGMATVWEVPAVKAQIYVEFARASHPLLSHDRKTLLFLDGDLPRAFQAETLQPTGDGEPVKGLPKSSVPLVARNLILSADGGELTGLFQWGTFGPRYYIARWDMRTGQSLGGFDFQAIMLPSASPTRSREEIPFQCAGSFYLVNNQYLIDKQSHAVVWAYGANMMMGRTLTQPIDERLWYLQSPGFNQPALLAAAPLPDRTTQEIIAKIQKNENLVVGPDSLVSIRASLGSRSSDQAFAANLAKGMKRSLERAGLIFLEEAPLAWQLEFKETDTGKTRVIYRSGNTNPEVVKLIDLEAKASLVKEGQTLWAAPSMKWSMRDQAGRIPADEKSPQEFFQKKLWDAALAWALSVTPPGRILSLDGKYHSLPGISQLTPNGWVIGQGK